MFGFKSKTPSTNNTDDPFLIKLGQKVEDKITGFSGVVTGVSRHLTGCDIYLVQPPVKDQEYKEGRWLDEGRLKITPEEPISKEEVKSSRSFGHCGEPPIK